MSRPKKPALPDAERSALQSHIRAGLRALRLTQSQWACETLALKEIRRDTAIERSKRRRKLVLSRYAFIRTHLKHGDPHFTYETAHRLATWLIETFDARIREIEDRDDARYVQIAGKSLFGGPYVELRRLWDDWHDQFNEVAPSLQDWYAEGHPELDLSPASFDTTAQYVARALKLAGLVERNVARSVSSVVSSALYKHAREQRRRYA